MSVDNKYKPGYVIARTVGPKYNGSTKGCLTIGKSYEVISISYQKKNNLGYYDWVVEEFKYNPSRPIFYLSIREDDNGRTHSIWNDYFYSTEMLRELTINEILM